jgi:hypothetical protein
VARSAVASRNSGLYAGEPTPRLRLALKADIDGGLLPRILDAYASVTRRYPRPEIAYRPVSDLEPATLAVAWPQDSHSPAVAAFARAAATVAGAAAPEAGNSTKGSYLIAKTS